MQQRGYLSRVRRTQTATALTTRGRPCGTAHPGGLHLWEQLKRGRRQRHGLHKDDASLNLIRPQLVACRSTYTIGIRERNHGTLRGEDLSATRGSHDGYQHRDGHPSLHSVVAEALPASFSLRLERTAARQLLGSESPMRAIRAGDCDWPPLNPAVHPGGPR